VTAHEQHAVVREIIGRFEERTQGSRESDNRAKQVLPGGDTRSSTYFAPYPAYMERGSGCRVYDFDENEYLDFLNNYTSLIHGHTHQPTIEAIEEQIRRGTVLGSVSNITVQLAELLCQRVPSLELIRFCNSGTEATMLAIRAARAFTGRDKIIKMDGGYHGSHDTVQVNIQPDITSDDGPQPRLAGRGVPASVLDETIVVPFNDVEAIEDALKAQGDTIAAIILEPVIGSGGGVEPLPGYLQGIRQLADDYGTLLIFDEVLTFRLGYGGLQGHYDVRPDLTAIGKIIGGGLPVGAFGGRRDIMAAFNPLDPKTLVHSGTFNGNNITMAAGLATMRAFGDTEVARINHLGDRLINGLSQALSANGIQAHASGPGSVVRIQWQAEKVRTGREAAQAKNAVKLLPKLIHLELMNRGIFLASRCQFAVSTPMTEIEIDQAILAFGEALTVVRPYIADEVPHLLST